MDDVSAWQELLDASAGDEQAQKWYTSMKQQAQQRAAAAEPATRSESWVKCLNNRHDQDDIDKKALEDGFIFIYDKPAVESAAAALAPKPVAASEIPQPQEIAVVEPQMEPAAEPAAAASGPEAPEAYGACGHDGQQEQGHA